LINISSKFEKQKRKRPATATEETALKSKVQRKPKRDRKIPTLSLGTNNHQLYQKFITVNGHYFFKENVGGKKQIHIS